MNIYRVRLITQTADRLRLANSQTTRLADREPAVRVDRWNIAHRTASFHYFDHVLGRHTTIADIADLPKQAHAVQRIEHKSEQSINEIGDNPNGEHTQPRTSGQARVQWRQGIRDAVPLVDAGSDPQSTDVEQRRKRLLITIRYGSGDDIVTVAGRGDRRGDGQERQNKKQLTGNTGMPERSHLD